MTREYKTNYAQQEQYDYVTIKQSDKNGVLSGNCINLIEKSLFCNIIF